MRSVALFHLCKHLHAYLVCLAIALVVLPSCKKEESQTPDSDKEKVTPNPYPNQVQYMSNLDFPQRDTALEKLLDGKRIVDISWQEWGDFYNYPSDTSAGRAEIHPGDNNILIMSCLINDSTGRAISSGLYEYDIAKDQMSLLTKTKVGVTEFSINKEGDILFRDQGNTIWFYNKKLPAKQLIIDEHSCISVVWKYDGSQFAVIYAYPFAQKQELAFYDKNFKRDSFQLTHMGYINLWPLDNFIIARSFLYHDIENDTTVTNQINPGVGAVTRACMTRKGELLFGTSKGNLAAYNFGTNEVSLVLEGNAVESLANPMFSAQDSSVYFLSGKYNLIDSISLKTSIQLYKMGMNGSNPKLVKRFN